MTLTRQQTPTPCVQAHLRDGRVLRLEYVGAGLWDCGVDGDVVRLGAVELADVLVGHGPVV